MRGATVALSCAHFGRSLVRSWCALRPAGSPRHCARVRPESRVSGRSGGPPRACRPCHRNLPGELTEAGHPRPGRVGRAAPPDHPHHRERNTSGHGRRDPAARRRPAVLPYRSPSAGLPAPTVRSDVRAVLADWGLTETEAAAYEEAGAFDDGTVTRSRCQPHAGLQPLSHRWTVPDPVTTSRGTGR